MTPVVGGFPWGVEALAVSPSIRSARRRTAAAPTVEAAAATSAPAAKVVVPVPALVPALPLWSFTSRARDSKINW